MKTLLCIPVSQHITNEQALHNTTHQIRNKKVVSQNKQLMLWN